MKLLGSVLLWVAVAASLAPPQRARHALGAAQKLNVPPARFAYIDSKLLAEKGVKLDEDREALADLKTFGEGLKVNIIDAEKLRGALFIADDRLDVTDAFLAAWKAKPSRSAPLQVPAVNIPAVGAAFINTNDFSNPETGIDKLLKVFKSIEKEFKPRRDELIKMRQRLESGSGDRKRLEEEINQKEAAAKAELDKRVMETTGPIYEDIAKSLTPFCKQHGIALLFDTSKILKLETLPPFDVNFPAGMPDVTAAFVSAYNKGTR
ncbi:MAG TPA: OmpH family outer membrane protein [Pyrinomonadaceae bacterium]